MSRSVVVLALTLAAAAGSPPSACAQGPGVKGRKVVKTDAEWRKVLTRAQYEVTRQKATEPPFSGKLVGNHARGTYDCVCCGAPLFSSQAKFDSGTGWPSFWRPIDPNGVETAPDVSLAERRIEVICRDCGAHLGHVFDDGPAPTGLRYCINSVSLKFVPLAGYSPAKKTRTKAKKPQAPDAPSADTPAGDQTETPKADAPDKDR